MKGQALVAGGEDGSGAGIYARGANAPLETRGAIALWIWMAKLNEAGRSWARITSTIFFAIWTFYAYSSVNSLKGGMLISVTLIISLALLVGLFSYYFHGLMNNFLDTDKISALFWGYTAMLVAMDVYHKDRQDEPGDQST